jgi:Pentapeptide repeats (8 copies)
MRPSRCLRLACLCLLLAGTTWAREPDACPHPKGWKPTQEELQRILSLHNQWAEEHSGLLFRGILLEVGAPDPRRANLCNVDLRGFKLNNANLSGAQLNGADFFTAELNNAYLRMAELDGVDLIGAKLNNADLVDAKLNGAVLRSAKLNNANLGGAQLNNADFYLAELNNARLNGAVLKRATLSGAYLTGALLAAVDLTGAEYAPASAGPPDAFVEGIMGLETVVFPRGQESGLMQLRELLQKAGLRELEREATFAIEYGRTRHAIAGWRQNFGAAAEGIFRMMAFDWTTGYGLYPGRALKIIFVVWLLLILVYFWPIRLTPERSLGAGIYQVWPSDRIETNGGKISVGKSIKISRLQCETLAAIGRAGYFSLLSAFHIGWRDLNVGTWIARVQPREYALRATGWVRVISGIQSLLSVYLLAMWALTYFGRPFQ